MGNLLKKEWRLAMHPMVPLMLCLSGMVLIPNYPFSVIFFYTTLAVFFTCLTGRENNDIGYSLMLPIAKGDIVKGRMMAVVLQELVQLGCILPFLPLSLKLNPRGNLAGMDANLALLGLGLVVYGVFNCVFFPCYYKNVAKVGRSFLLASVAVFLLVALDVAGSYTIPFVRDCLDTPGLAFLPEKLLALGVGAVIFGLLTALAYRRSLSHFLTQDL